MACSFIPNILYYSSLKVNKFPYPSAAVPFFCNLIQLPSNNFASGYGTLAVTRLRTTARGCGRVVNKSVFTHISSGLTLNWHHLGKLEKRMVEINVIDPFSTYSSPGAYQYVIMLQWMVLATSSVIKVKMITL